MWAPQRHDAVRVTVPPGEDITKDVIRTEFDGIATFREVGRASYMIKLRHGSEEILFFLYAA